MPDAVPNTQSRALNHATLSFGLALAAKHVQALIDDPHLRRGLNVHRGRISCEPVARAGARVGDGGTGAGHGGWMRRVCRFRSPQRQRPTCTTWP